MPHQTRRRQAHRMEGERHAVADQYTFRGVRAPAVHLDVRHIPLRAVLDEADLLGDARDVVRPDFHSVVFNPDVVKLAMLSAERDIDKPRSVGQRQDDLQRPLFIRNPDDGVVLVAGGLDLVALSVLGLAKAGWLQVALLIENANLSIARIERRDVSVKSNLGILEL